jgi:hypothetical protein
MCLECWKTVSPETQTEVYRTVKLRDKRSVDETWAPWWRASHKAMAEAAIAAGLDGHVREGTDADGKPLGPWSVERWLAKEMAFAESLEEKKAWTA